MAENINDLFEISYNIFIPNVSPEIIKILNENKIDFKIWKNLNYTGED